ncbi:MAG: hypothetical protein IPK07_32510 [Deltaproteobacteria bacterium]|nr:hypothetical protein [Deltaproteobacteria bacterium]
MTRSVLRAPVRAARALFAVLALVGVAACGSSSDGSATWNGDRGPYGSVVLPAEPQDPGDAAAGRTMLLNGGYMTCGIPYKIVGNPLLAPFLGGFGDGHELDGREGHNRRMPYSMNAFTAPNGAEVVNSNCLTCHGGEFDGQLYVGLGNAAADWTVGLPAVTIPESLLDLLGLSAAGKANLTRMLSAAGALTQTRMRTVGNNPAEIVAVVLMAHHDRDTLAWSDEPLAPLEPRDEHGNRMSLEDARVTSDPPPWWRAHKKNALFYNGMARGDHRGTMALATSVCVDDVEQAKRVDGMFKDMQTYIGTLKAPHYTRGIDRDLAGQGRAVFLADCANCHGTHAADPDDDSSDTYPNLLFPLDVIGTDPVVANAGVIHAPELVEWYNNSFYGRITRMTPADPFPGYIAPPLDGIWATAPYFHNGSVPSIALVLDSEARPRHWKRVDSDSTHFDEEAMGWPWAEVPYSQADAPDGERKHVFDTTYWSQSNGGHTFGDRLTARERRAVIEYLKTL